MYWHRLRNPSFSIKYARLSARATTANERRKLTFIGLSALFFFHNKRHPIEMGEVEIAQFLSSLASDSHVSASTQNQALNALIFRYREVLGKSIGYIDGVVRAKRVPCLPTVLTRDEIKAILNQLQGVKWLMTAILYGAGVRLMEYCRLRVKDIDFSREPNNGTGRQGQ
jgi:integrase